MKTMFSTFYVKLLHWQNLIAKTSIHYDLENVTLVWYKIFSRICKMILLCKNVKVTKMKFYHSIFQKKISEKKIIVITKDWNFHDQILQAAAMLDKKLKILILVIFNFNSFVNILFNIQGVILVRKISWLYFAI